MKATNKVPPYSPQSSTSGDSLKRQSLKKQISRTTAHLGSAVRKSKTADDMDKHHLSKLRALVTSDAPKKEVVVQTNKGVLKFEGISREFTRKLYEWEKARGIGPESSTFAFFHPGYKPVIVESGLGDNLGAEKKRKYSGYVSWHSILTFVFWQMKSHLEPYNGHFHVTAFHQMSLIRQFHINRRVCP